MAFIELQKLEKRYKRGDQTIEAVNKVDLKIDRGEFVSILGPSGSGKSTLLHTIGTLDKPDSGRILVANQNVTALKDRKASKFRNKTIGFVFQTFNLVPTLTALENVILPLTLAGISGKKAKQMAEEALDVVGLKNRSDHKPSELSGGEMQRVAIARAISNNPQIILADEPTGNLDSKTGRAIMQVLKDLNRKGHTVIIVTHNKEHSKYAQRVIQVLDGKIISDTRQKRK